MNTPAPSTGLKVSQRAELKPCPFCGGEATCSTYQTESLWSHSIVTYTQVGCSECDYSIKSEPGYEVEAPDLWNRRPAETLASLSSEVQIDPVNDTVEAFWHEPSGIADTDEARRAINAFALFASTPSQSDVIEKCAAIVDDAARTWRWEASEEDGFAYRNKVCAERCAQWGDDCKEEEDQPGACEECKSDMHEHFETRASKERRSELRRLAAAIRQLASKEGQHHGQG